MNRFCPACHRTEVQNGNTLTAERTTCPRDFFQLEDPQLVDPIQEIFGGAYQTESCVLAGNKHAIFKVIEPATGRQAMVSVLSARDADTARIIKFAEGWSQIKHINILPVTTYGASPDGKYFYVISEYPKGEPLTVLLDQHGNIAPDLAIHFFLQLCEAVQRIGDAGIIHGNIMPAHIFHVQESDIPNHIRLSCDSALTRFLSTSPDAVSEVSPLYLGLEFMKDGESPDASTEVYSLGCVMYVILTGLPPFSGRNFDELKESHLQVQPLSLRGAAPDLDIPGLFDKLVLKALRKERGERHVNAKALKEDLIVAAEKSRIYLPTYATASYEAKPYTGDTGAYKTQTRNPADFLQGSVAPTGSPPPVVTQPEEPAVEPDSLPPETRVELESKVKDLRSHVYLVTTVAVLIVIGLGAILAYEGPEEDRAPAWKKLSWMMDMASGDGNLKSKNFEKAKESYTNALNLADFIQDGGDRKVKTLRKMRAVHEQLHDKRGAERIREEIIKFDKQRLQQDEAPIK